MPEEHALPPVVARMWGREPETRRGPRPRLDLPTIVAAAIEIADAEGLAGVSMSNVAKRVGLATMALYRYVGSKEDLLAIMADRAAPAPPERGDLGRREYLTEWTRANRDFLLDHPWFLSIAKLGPPVGPQMTLWFDRALAALDGVGLDAGERVNVVTALTGYALTDAALALGNADSPLAEAGLKGATDYGDMLAKLVDPERYPALSAVVGEGAFEGADEWHQDDDFYFGLDLLLDGVEALIARRAQPPDSGPHSGVSAYGPPTSLPR
ncbi:TetR/AcrR family transcriptional regulator [Nonomuraea sp. NN258]|uniref:TetR/AcrR family transcriptional regulator n=1 Tax=Nonomuraea antri TaxID=2730852 RepID=UPI001569B45C|nr:TetR/AcrR family transcriptional regulator [Nonomuraea antri]NRQ35609.1 TetR/AcrR family transcriptional regulator [Nonomuraea antri]